MGATRRLVFSIRQKDILNSNTIPSHFIVKGNMVAFLRKLARAQGHEAHEGEAYVLVEEKLGLLDIEAETAVRKNRLRKRLKKDPELTPEQIEAEIAEQFDDPEAKKSSDVVVPPLFSQFTVRMTVCPPTRRRVDPPNLYPSMKALLDGLTDAAWWEDDDYSHLLDVSFRYGGLSGEKGAWKLVLDIEEVDDPSLYNTVSEVA